MAQEVNTHKREDVSMGTPPMRPSFLTLPQQSQDRSKAASWLRGTTSALPSKRSVIPPASEGTPHIVWELNKAMNWAREASRQWGVKIRKVKTADGFEELLLCPNTYYKKAADLCLSCHGDDFLASGEKEELDALDKLISGNDRSELLGDSFPLQKGEVEELMALPRWSPAQTERYSSHVLSKKSTTAES